MRAVAASFFALALGASGCFMSWPEGLLQGDGAPSQADGGVQDVAQPGGDGPRADGAVGTDGARFDGPRPDGRPRDAWPGDGGSRDVGVADGSLPADRGPADVGTPDTGCTPGAALGCQGNLLVRCNTLGTGTLTVDCGASGCNATAKRCSQCDPAAAPYCSGSNLMACTSDGLLQATPCSLGCVGNACSGCLDGDGDGYGVGPACKGPDCNDSNGNIHPGGVEVCNTADDNCDGTKDEGVQSTFYRDSDRDGYGDATKTTLACTAPQGYVPNKDDCDDGDRDAHPGQSSYFDSGSNGTGTFDYNCNTTVEQRWPVVATCAGQPPSRCNNTSSGWQTAVAGCGVRATWLSCNWNAGSCQTNSSNRTQECR
ncbi:MAG: putative metal-binding motif-containing protein [Deltaproteobacteria bacterium]|nr:putative metal-binding motif-containing protein [Deltaproteobacteria bacterium]